MNRATRLALLTVLALALALGACSRLTGPRSFTISMVDADGRSWTVVVNDASGRVTDADADPDPLFADQAGMPFNPPGPPGVLVVPWVGGACDTQTTFTVEPSGNGGIAIAVATAVEPGACESIGIAHQLVLHTTPAVPAALVTVIRRS